MKETLVRFGQPPLEGVLTVPADGAAQGPAMVFCNAGMLARVGPHRLHVDLARALAQRGRAALRFDFSGVGGSPARPDLLAAEEYTVQELRSAFDCLEQRLGIRRMLVFGLCSGAEVALRAAQADARVAGAVLVNPEFLAEEGGERSVLAISRARVQRRGHLGRLFEVRALKNLARGRADWRAALSALIAGGARRPAAAEPARLRLDPAPLAAGRTQFLIVYSDRDPQWEAFRMCVLPRLPAQCPTLEICVLPAADHVLTPPRSRAVLRDRLLEWALARA